MFARPLLLVRNVCRPRDRHVSDLVWTHRKQSRIISKSIVFSNLTLESCLNNNVVPKFPGCPCIWYVITQNKDLSSHGQLSAVWSVVTCLIFLMHLALLIPVQFYQSTFGHFLTGWSFTLSSTSTYNLSQRPLCGKIDHLVCSLTYYGTSQLRAQQVTLAIQIAGQIDGNDILLLQIIYLRITLIFSKLRLSPNSPQQG